MKLQKQRVFDPKFCARLFTMLEASLINHRHYYPWADEVILTVSDPPLWVFDLAVAKSPPALEMALASLRESADAEYYGGQNYEDQYLACLWLRYDMGAISWATFLLDAGLWTDALNGFRHCEEFYYPLTEFENDQCSREVEHRQSEEFAQDYQSAIASMRELFDEFAPYLRRYIEDKKT